MANELPLISPDKFHDECAVFGIYGHKEAANLAYLGLYALQHRGQEASGIVSNDGEQFYVEKGQGLVADIFSQQALARSARHDGDRPQPLFHRGWGGPQECAALERQFRLR
jgi:amidophosphoribosyltransferase